MIGARLLFTYGANHWCSHALGQWLTSNQVTIAGLTDALIQVAIGMVLTRVARYARAFQPRRGSDPEPRVRRRLRDSRSAHWHRRRPR
ncbi:MAG: hypothetical protein JOY56_13215 [Solirubrobacterales bacterium]|nr:hypothetical protein [Solirubrobacterales bacterium]